MSITFQFNVPSITCYSCVNAIENILKPHHFNIDQSQTNPFKQKIAVRADDDHAQSEDVSREIQHYLSEAGYDCTEINRKKDEGQEAKQKTQRDLIRNYLIKGVLGTVIGSTFFGLCLSGIMIPLVGMWGLSIISIILTLSLGADTYRHAIKSFFKSKTFTMDSLFTISTLTTVAITFASLFKKGLPMMMEAGLLTFGFRYIGKAIEETIKNKISHQLLFQNRAPCFIEKLNSGQPIDTDDLNLKNFAQWVPIKVKDVNIGDVVRVKGGSVVPIDGKCVNPSAIFVNEATIRGSTMPTLIKRGDKILAGAEVPAGEKDLLIRVMRVQAESHLAKLDKAMHEANETSAPIENTANKILKYFIPSVLVLAALSGILVSSFFSPALAIQCATSVLVAACPCTLGFVTPLAIEVAMVKALEYGIRFKNGESLQKASQIDTVAFDLNGTLTQGKPKVMYYQIGETPNSVKDVSKEQTFFNYLFHIERKSNHPIAKLVCDYIQKNKANTITPLSIDDNAVTHDHAGLHARIGDDEYWVGNQSFLKSNKIHLPTKSANFALNQTATSIYLLKNRQLLGMIGIDDPLREETVRTIAALRRKKIDIHIITGAEFKTAQYYAKKLNIPLQHIHANCVDALELHTQHSKLAAIAALQKSGKIVMMVGDAGNDAIALRKSNCGVAICSDFSDAITQQEADAVIENNLQGRANKPLTSILAALDIAQETVHSIKQNLIVSLVYNTTMVLLAGGALLALGLALNPGICVGIMILQTTFILLNAYRVRHRTLPNAALFTNEQSSLDRNHEKIKEAESSLDQRREHTQHNDCKDPAANNVHESKTTAIKIQIKHFLQHLFLGDRLPLASQQEKSAFEQSNCCKPS